MKKLILYLVALVAVPSVSLAQAAQHIFFEHGFGQSSSAMQNIADDLKSRFNWSQSPSLMGYNNLSLSGFRHEVNNDLYPNLYAIAPGGWIGAGYSAGGLMCRDLVNAVGNTTFETGLVTIHTPNSGAQIANLSDRSQYIFDHVAHEVQLHRGEDAFFAVVAGYAAAPWLIIIEALSALAQLGDGLLQDMNPGSSFLSGLNSTTTTEASLGAKRAQVLGAVRYPYSASYADDVNGPTNWWNSYYSARDKSHNYDQSANNINDGRQWYLVWKWPSVWWNRSRAGDWTAVANAMADDENSWSYHTARNVESDWLISSQSQFGIPGTTSKRITVGDCNHGNAIYYTSSYDAVFKAFQDAGAH